MIKTLLISKKGKAILALTAIVVCAGIIGTVSKAQTEKRASNIKSKGVFDYDNGTVVMDASDLIYLADEIDLLEETYKKETVNALSEMNTYFMLDNSTTHNPDESNLDQESSSVLPFHSIIDGILKSQSIPEEKTYTGTLPGEEEEVTGNISGATEENLSLGTAAWVDGELIIGNGADNNSYYNQGYQDGTADGLKHIYENEVFQENYATVSCGAYTAVNYGHYGDSDSVHETYNIPLSTDKFLYAIQYDLTGKCSSNRQGVGSGEIKVQLKTTEGTIIGVGTWSGRCQDGQQDSSSKHIVIDLLATNFSTEGDHLLLDIFENASVSRITNDDSRATVTLSCNNIVAKYK